MTARVFSHAPVLGTALTVSVECSDAVIAGSVDRLVVDEIERLEGILSRFRSDSALERWKRDELTEVPTELAETMARAMAWTARTDGLLDPRAAALTACWRRAAVRGGAPSAHEVAAVLAVLAQPGFDIDASGVPRRLGDCADLDLHAFAKGWIVDRALAVAVAAAPEVAVLVNAGGDIARAGSGASFVAIDDPLRPYDNADPIDRIVLRRGGLATSGSARRGFDIDGRRVSHILDPRTGQPAAGSASVSVLADSAEAADAWATALSLVPPDRFVRAADEADIAAMAVLGPGSTLANDRWSQCRVAG